MDNKDIEELIDMKKIFLVLLGASLSISASFAQVLEQGEAALVYYSPKTSVVLDFTYTVETQIRGQFAHYAEELLGATDVVNTNSTSYTLKDVHIGTSTSADQTRPHKITADGGIPMLLTINDKGLLKGYNIDAQEEKPVKNLGKSTENPRVKSRISSKRIAPYSEEVAKAISPVAQAQEAAKQIFHIRETRMYLLSGEVERAPADGKSMELVLKELDEQEKVLTELFIGQKTTKTEHKKITISSIGKNSFQDRQIQKEFVYFSEENGFTNKENVDADSITVWIGRHKTTYKPQETEEKKPNKKGNELSQISYNLPGSAVIRVLYKGRLLGELTIDVAQLGIDVPLPKNLFTNGDLPKIVFNEKTGNIISISK